MLVVIILLLQDGAESPALQASIPQVSSQAEILVEEALSRTPSSRLLSRSRHSSFRTTSMEPISPGATQASGHGMPGRPLRLRSFKRNRPSFIHVTAEAMQRQRSLRMHASPWEFTRYISNKITYQM